MRFRFALTVVFSSLFFLPAGAQNAPAGEDGAPRWPRAFDGEDGTSLIVYQPQVDSWDNYETLRGRAAVQLKRKGVEKDEVGGVVFSVSTRTDTDARTVRFSSLKLEKVVVPGLDGAENVEAEATVRALFPKGNVVESLDTVLASLGRSSVKKESVKVNNDPPKFIVSYEDSILVSIQGEPVMGQVEGTDLLVVLNTETTLLRHGPTSRYYLLLADSWIVAPDLNGPWKPAGKLPAGFQKLPADDDNWTEVRKSIPGQPLAADAVPAVYVSTEPAELLVIEGKPELSPVPGTKLLYVKNSDNDLFFAPDQNWYVLVSGRWFRTKEPKTGPWTFCTEDLPEDFANISPDHETGRVLVSVPGTDQALEAVLQAQIPTRFEIKRDEAKVEVTYEGDPVFEQITGTEVYYATNTSLDVFRVKDMYYCCYEAVWFSSRSPRGPWAVAGSVPKEIYTIPSTSEKYNVTYVYIYSSTPTVVYVGYRPSYLGVFVWSGLVIWGTAWRWHWRASFWHHRYRWGGHHGRRWHHGGWSGHRRPAHRPAYGHGRQYNHRTGRYDRSNRARSHHNNRRSYGGGRGGASRPRTRPVGRPARTNRDLYAGKSGRVYDKKGNNYNRADRGSRDRTKQQRAQSQQRAQRDSRARSNPQRRESQRQSYNQSRGSRTKGGQRGSSASRRGSGGGGARRGGGGGRRR